MVQPFKATSGIRRAAPATLISACLALVPLALALAEGAEAKLPPADDDQAPPGITVTGIGFARVLAPQSVNEQAIEQAIEAAKPTAVSRAVRDARRRGGLIADALGLDLGAADHVGLEDPFRHFGWLRHCTHRGGKRNCDIPALTAVSAEVTFAIVGGTDGSSGATISAVGVGQASVMPRARRNAAIRRSLLAARRVAMPEAAIAARRNGRAVAEATGLDLGPVVSVSPPDDALDPFSLDPALGTWGPGRFCKVIQQRTWKTDPETGVSEPTGTVRRFRCLYQRIYSQQLEIVYQAS